jgi:hypothetical protein
MSFKMAGISHQTKCRSSFIGHPDVQIRCRIHGFFTKKEKEAKRKKGKRGGLWKLPQLWKSAEKRGFPQLLGKASQNPLGFSTVTTGPTAVNIQPLILVNCFVSPMGFTLGDC